MLDIVTLGHIVYDVRCYVKEFPRPDKTTFMQSSVQTGGGGSAANTAVDAVVLGKKAGVIGNLGNDREGAFLLQDLLRSGVDVSRVRVIKGKSAMAIILINSKADVEVVEMLGVTEPVQDVDLEYLCEAKLVHLAGCNLDALEKASKAGKSGVTVSFDPGRGKAHLGVKALEKILKNTDFLLLNRHELSFLTGASDALESAKSLSKRFGFTVVVKSGKDPVLAVSGKDSFKAPPFDVKPVDTIGAGDAFDAGFIAAVLEGKSLEKSVRFANAVAAAKVLHRGARALPPRAEIEKLFKVK